MWILDIPGHQFVRVVSGAILSIIYTYLAFALFNEIRLRNIFKKKSYENINSRNLILSIISGIILGTAMIGIVFKTQSFPGTVVFLFPAAIGVILIFITVFIFYFILNKKELFFKKLFIRTLLIGSITLFLFFVPDKDWYYWKYKEFPDYYEAIIEIEKYPDSLEIQQKLEIERQKMVDELYPENETEQ